MRGSCHAAASKALKYAKRKTSSATAPVRRKGKAIAKRKKPQKSEDKQDSYHFIGYVPSGGRVWELDGLRFSGPLDVGEISEDATWMDIVRPVLKMRMQSYLSGADKATDHIRYNLLAIVDDKFRKVSDELEMLKRERTALERRLQEVHSEAWSMQVS